MNNYFSWLMESGISLAIFYLAYRIFLNRENLFQSNRGFLLFALVFSALLPFIKIPSPVELHYSYYLPEVAVTVNTLPAGIEVENQISMLQILWYAYLLGVAIMFGTFLYRLNQLIHIIRRSQVERKGKILFAKTKLSHTPFSFLNVIIFNDETLSWEEKDKIMEHEGVHVNQLHTLDILLVEIIAIFQWFNPFIWLYKISLKELHEYLADREVIRKGANIPVYQQLLLNFQLRRQYITLANNFNYSLTKKRFTMMTKRKPGFMAWIKLFMLLPLLSLLLVSMTNFDTGKSLVLDNDQSTNPTSIEFSQTINDPLLAFHYGDTSLIPVIRQEKMLPPPPPPASLQKNGATDSIEAEEIFIIVEEMPKFMDEDSKKFREYINENIIYPEEAAKAGIQGRVFVSFIVDDEGEVKDAKIVRGVHELLDAEAIRVVEASPKWIPGKQRGKVVNVQFTFPILFSLSNETSEEIVPITTSEKPSSQDTFIMVEEMPKFMDGDSKKFREYINENVVYPEEAAKAGIQGRVFIQFTIDTEGKVKEVSVVRGVHELLDAAAMRVVKNSPDWTPGKQRGKPVNVQMTFPIHFSLEE